MHIKALSLFIVLHSSATFDNGQNINLVKKSTSGICHNYESPYFDRTLNYESFNSIEDCLNSGGRLPNSATLGDKVSSRESFDRGLFGNWLDEDRDCLNTRHEILKSLSTVTVVMSQDGCNVLRGRWIDPYSSELILDASLLDIDHLVPLFWAWTHGASDWSKDKLESFANDPSNLFAVKLELNRAKGSKGPSEWLPPNDSFHCQYVTRFLRVLKNYEFDKEAQQGVIEVQDKVCKD